MSEDIPTMTIHADVNMPTYSIGGKTITEIITDDSLAETDAEDLTDSQLLTAKATYSLIEKESHDDSNYAKLNANNTFTAVQTITSTSINVPLRIFNPSMTTNNDICLGIGKNDTSNNAAIIQYYNSSTPTLRFGFWNNDNIISYNTSKNVSMSGNLTVTGDITANGVNIISALAGKANTSHTHKTDDITRDITTVNEEEEEVTEAVSLNDILDSKAKLVHTHSINDITDYTPPVYSVTPPAQPEPLTWVETSIQGTYGYWRSVCYGNGKFVAVEVGYARAGAYSYDGITWTKTSIHGTYGSWRSVCYGNGKFVTVSTEEAAYSYDGITWIVVTISGAYGNWVSVCYGNGKFVAVEDGHTNAAYSYDGITWIVVTISGTNRHWDSVCYGNGKFVTVAYDSTNTAAYSYDGINWIETTISEIGRDWYSVCYGNGKFVAVEDGYTNAVTYSYDGVNWIETTISGTYESWRSVCYGNGKFVAVAYDSTKAVYAIDVLPQPTYSNDLDALSRMILQRVYPVGSIYTSMNDANPSALFGFGTWERIADKFLYCTGESVAGNVGGETTHTHPLSNNGYAKIATYSDGFIISEISNYGAGTLKSPAWWCHGSDPDYGSPIPDGRDGWASHLGGNTDSTSNLPPYMTVYAWQRTA